ncbi:GNAT family N-acetyltransferase [Streptomyces olivaceoviridis]|uniref:GNAT family N-acetyltransferase n=1 Tax=Streptomyces olivaceoviridis TaxID=1921 RepID=UPI00367A2FA6
MSDIDVRDAPSRHRHEITVDGQLAGLAGYDAEGQRIAFVHTEVAPSYEGHGLGDIPAWHSPDDMRGRDLRAGPLCPYYPGRMSDHPDYRD